MYYLYNRTINRLINTDGYSIFLSQYFVRNCNKKDDSGIIINNSNKRHISLIDGWGYLGNIFYKK